MEETITQRKMDDEIEQYTQTRIEGTGGVILYSIITLCTGHRLRLTLHRHICLSCVSVL